MRRESWFICFWLFGLSVLHAQEQKDIHSLKKGDWVIIESVEYYPFEAPGVEEEVPWRPENIRRVEVKATVTDRNKEIISFDFSVRHIYDARNNATDQTMLLFDSDYQYTNPITFSPWYMEGYDRWEMGDQETVLAKGVYDIRNGALLDSIVQYENLYLYYTKDIFSFGLRKKEKQSIYPLSGVVDIAPVIWEEWPGFLAGWIQKESLIASKRTEADPLNSRLIYTPIFGKIPEDVSHKLLPREIRLTDASFPLPANVTLTYRDPSSSVSEEKKIFIPRPGRYVIEDKGADLAKVTWLVTPGDSLCGERESDDMIKFSGRGKVQNEFYYRQNRALDHIYTPYTFKDESLQYDETEMLIMEEYEFKQMNSFWQRTFVLSDYYVQAGTKLNHMNYRKEDKASWDLPYFIHLSPLTDFCYNPIGYGRFLESYTTYKGLQVSAENVNKTIWIPQADLRTVYNWGKLLLVGYPRYKRSADVLVEMFRFYMLEDIRYEYEEFMRNCPDSILVRSIRKQHAVLEELERGKNIKDTKLSLVKELIPRFGSGRRYCVVFLYTGSGDHKNRINELKNLLQQKGLGKEVKIYSFQPNSSSKNQVSLVTEELKRVNNNIPIERLKQDLEEYGDYYNMTLLMREDGTILLREWNPFRNEKDLADLVEKDINRPYSDFWKGFWKGFVITGLVGLFVILIIRSRLTAKRKKEKQLRQLKELELKAIRSQMNPHFIFNALGSIQNLINRGDLKMANEYLVQFSRLLRKVLNNSEKKLIPLSEEIEQLYLYLDLEQLRFPFTFSILTDQNVEADLIEIPGMLIQPFVENAIKHAIAPRGKGNIRIMIALEGSGVRIDILDDGPGYIPGKSEGFGMKAMVDEFEILKTLYQGDIGIEISDRQEKEGTAGCHISLLIPVE